jgi:hypothetical protein
MIRTVEERAVIVNGVDYFPQLYGLCRARHNPSYSERRIIPSGVDLHAWNRDRHLVSGMRWSE